MICHVHISCVIVLLTDGVHYMPSHPVVRCTGGTAPRPAALHSQWVLGLPSSCSPAAVNRKISLVTNSVPINTREVAYIGKLP